MTIKARFEHRLLTGVHVGPDYDQPVIQTADGKPRKDGKRPSRSYQQGETVWDNKNLVVLHGAEKFSLTRDHGPRADSRPKELRATVAAPGPGGIGNPVLSTTAGDNPVPGDPTLAHAPASFPGGQVSTGKQETTSLPDGRTVSGPATPTEEEAQEAADNAENLGTETYAGESAEDADETEAEKADAKALEEMSAAELRQFAEEEEIQLHGARSKEDMIKTIKKARRRKR